MITSLAFAAAWFLSIIFGLIYLFHRARIRKKEGLSLPDKIMIRIGDNGIIFLRKKIVDD